MRSFFPLLGFFLAHAAFAAPVTTRTFNDWTSHFGFGFGTNLVASVNTKGFQVASLPPDRSVLMQIPFPADCPKNFTPHFEWMDAGFATALCNQKAYLFDLKTGSVTELAANGINPAEVANAFQEDSVILDRGNGKYDFFGWDGSAVTHSYLRMDTQSNTISEVALDNRGSPLQAIPQTYRWQKLDENSTRVLFAVITYDGHSMVAELNKATLTVTPKATLPDSFSSSSRYFAVPMGTGQLYLLEFDARNFQYSHRALIVDVSHGKVESLTDLPFLEGMLKINGLRYDPATQQISLSGSAATGCFGTCASTYAVLHTYDVRTGAHLLTQKPYYPLAGIGDAPTLYGERGGYSTILQEYHWAFDQAGSPVLFRTFGYDDNKALVDAETFDVAHGFSRDFNTLPNFHYCALDVPLKDGRVLHAGGYVNSIGNFISATLDAGLTIEDTHTKQFTVLRERFASPPHFSGDGYDVTVGPQDCGRIPNPTLISYDGKIVVLQLQAEQLKVNLANY